MKHCPRAVSIARPSTLQLTALPSELAAAPNDAGGDCIKVGMVQKKGIIKMEMMYQFVRGGMVHEEITKGRDCEEGGHCKRKG